MGGLIARPAQSHRQRLFAAQLGETAVWRGIAQCAVVVRVLAGEKRATGRAAQRVGHHAVVETGSLAGDQ
jgi:hypothetical protein